MKKKVYISGPMETYENNNFDAFRRMENYLKSNGHEPVNPFDIPVDREFVKSYKAGRRDFMRKDIRHLTFCHSIVMLNGWNRSHGAQLERSVANEIGLEIIYEDELTDYE